MTILINPDNSINEDNFNNLVNAWMQAGKSHASAHQLVGEKVDEQRMQKNITYPDCKGLAVVSPEHWGYYTGNQLGILK